MPPLVLPAVAFVLGLQIGPVPGAEVIVLLAGLGFLASGPAAVRTWLSCVLLAFFGSGASAAGRAAPRAGWVLVSGVVERAGAAGHAQSRLHLRDAHLSSWPGTPRFRPAPPIFVDGPAPLRHCGRPGETVRLLAVLRPQPAPLSPWWSPALSAEIVGQHACRGVSPAPRASGLRNAVEDALGRLPATPGRAVLRALVTGDRSEITADVRDAFADAGLGHLLAVSGLHLTLVGGAIGAGSAALLSLRRSWLEAWGRARVTALGAAIGGAAFAGFVGAPPSASRAAVLLAVYAAGRLLRRARCALSALSVAVLTLLAFVPDWRQHPGFALSVAAVAGLIGFGRPSRARQRGVVGWLQASLRVSLLTSIATTPWALHAFGRVSAAGVVANLVAVPWASLIVLPGALLGAALSTMTLALGISFSNVARLAADALVGFAVWVASWPGAAVTLGAHWALPSGLLIAAGLVARRSRGLAFGLTSLAAAAGWAFTPGASVTFLPVGHGDAAFARTAGGSFLLFDTGTGPAFDAVVTTALRREGARRLDLVLISHADADHAGGLPSLRRRFEVGQVLTRPPDLPLEIRVDDAVVRVLGPLAPQRERGSDNDRSLVARLHLGACAVLFAGDIERAAERDLVRRYGDALRTDVLKVPHHGSDTSSSPAFLKRVAPRLAVVSVGRNPHGLPSGAALSRLARSGATVVRTDRAGPVELACDRRVSPNLRTGLD